MDIVTELDRLSEMHRSGSLTAEEFSAAKAALLASRPAAGAGAGGVAAQDSGVAGSGSEWASTPGLLAADSAPYRRPVAQGPTYSARVIVGVICILFGLFRIGSTLVGASMAQSYLDAMPSMSSSGFPGTLGEATFTDANGRPIDISPSPSFDQPIRGQMKSAIGMTATLGVLFGLVFLIPGVWLVVGGRGGANAGQAVGNAALRDRQG